MSRDYKKDQRERMPMIKALVALGLSYRHISQLISVSESSIANDIRSIGGADSFEDRPNSKKEIFTAIICKYAELVTTFLQSNEGLSDHENQLRNILAVVLEEDKILAFLKGVFMTMDCLHKPCYSPELHEYAELLSSLSQKKLLKESDPEENHDPLRYWQQYLCGVADESITAPCSRGEMEKDLAYRFSAEHRAGIMPVWPDEVKDVMDLVLRSLTPREEMVLRMQFGLGRPKLTLREIGSHFFVTPARIKDISAKARRKLLVSHRRKAFAIVVNPIGGSVERELKRRRLLEEDKRRRDELIKIAESGDPDEFFGRLLRRVDEWDMSIRTRHCLEWANITYVGQLVQMRDFDLLKVKNFGRKSLKEVKELLAEMGLHLSTKFDSPVKAALERGYELEEARK